MQDRCETVEYNGGRRERRTCTVLGGPGLCAQVADPALWPGLCRLIRVRTERRGPRGMRQRSVRHCISSRPVDAEALLALVRGHWRVPFGRGNGLHRTLDVQFREDDCRLRTGHGPAVMGIPRTGRPEHGAHGSTESRYACVHRAAARPDWTPPLDPGRCPALIATLRLPCGRAEPQPACQPLLIIPIFNTVSVLEVKPRQPWARGLAARPPSPRPTGAHHGPVTTLSTPWIPTLPPVTLAHHPSRPPRAMAVTIMELVELLRTRCRTMEPVYCSQAANHPSNFTCRP